MRNAFIDILDGIAFGSVCAEVHLASQITCITQGAFKNALTRGKRYSALEINEEKQQVRIQGDNQRLRWFPFYCFDLSGGELPVITQIEIEDFEEPLTHAVEVTIEFSDGDHRWCVCVTPKYLDRPGETIENTNITVRYSMEHMIVLSVDLLTPQIIKAAIRHIDAQNMLKSSTRKLNLA